MTQTAEVRKWDVIIVGDKSYIDTEYMTTVGLENSVIFETLKGHFHKMMATLEGIYSDPANRTIEGVEEFIEASKHSVSIGGPKYHDWKIENWLETELNK